MVVVVVNCEQRTTYSAWWNRSRADQEEERMKLIDDVDNFWRECFGLGSLVLLGWRG